MTTTAELLKTRVTDDEVVAWRREQLRRAGCRRFEAEILARRLSIDLHEAVDLFERGCPSRVALKILL
jgi:tRNA splicing endonuclease